MKVDSAHLAQARKVADAILYEGYLLYPYRQTAQKNQARFQFGVLMPPAYAAVDDCELSASQTECLLECPDAAQVRVLVRFLQTRHRIVQAVTPGPGGLREVAALTVASTEYTTWDEATEREQWAAVSVADLLSQDRNVEFRIGAGEASEDLIGSTGQQAGRLVYQWNGISGVIRLSAQRVAGPFGALRLQVRVENDTIPQAPVRSRPDGLQHALIGTHALIWVPGGKFLSMTEPPEWAAAEVAACVNVGTWPVLAGPRDCHDLLLSSPVILYDHPEIAAESPGELFDATEIDEILTLRTLALTDAEKQQARATDPRAAQIMDRLDDMPPEMLERMHGAIRYLKAAPAGPGAEPGREPAQPALRDESALRGGPVLRGEPALPGGPALRGGPALPDLEPGPPSVPWWDPGSDTSVSPETDHVVIAGVRVARGSRVRMRPGSRRADAQDLFLIGREATVEAVLHDVDGQVHVAVSPENDPAADLQRSHGRFLYFAPDEIEPIDGPAEPAPPVEPAGPGETTQQAQARLEHRPGQARRNRSEEETE
jgi:hypothetical protein